MMETLVPLTEKYQEHSALFEAFAELLTEPFFIVDEAEQIVGCNAPALQALGADTLGVLRKKADGKLSPLFVKEKGYFVPDKAAWMGPLGERHPTVALKKASGQNHPYQLHVQPVILNGDKLYLIYLNDIEMMQRAKRAQHYFESFKQQFLTNISHEFRTPMNSIIGFTGLLEQTKVDPLQREYIGHIQHSAGAMLENVENLLDLMQVESGAQKVRREPFKVYEEFETFAQGFCPIAIEKGISLFFMIDPHLPESMIGDAEKIKKVLRNLISNALKFTSKGGQVLVEIKVRELGRKTVVRYSVTDTGEGIPKEKMQTLLRPFASTRENQIRGKEGFGVGLTLAFKLLKLLGSELSVSSEVGKGSRFGFTLKHPRVSPAPFKLMKGSRIALWCEDPRDIIQLKILKKYLKLFNIDATELEGLMDGGLRGMDALFMFSRHLSRPKIEALKERYETLQIVPVIRPEQENEFLEAVSLLEAIVTYPLLPTKLYDTLSVIWKRVPKGLLKPEEKTKKEEEQISRKILVAEDNPINQKLIITILKQQGYDVTTADNGQIAVDLYNDNQYDAVLMDIDMPVMDGISATRVIKEIDRRDKRPFTPVIALTARALAGDRERIIGAGLDAHLSKPVDRELLLVTLERYLKMKDERNKKMQLSV